MVTKDAAPRRLFLCNPNARYGVTCEDLAALVRPGDGCTSTRSPADVVACVARAAAERYDAVVAVGGDSTVGQAAAALLAWPDGPVLALVPAGTGNDLARSLGVPLTLSAAVEALDHAVTRRVDVILADPDGQVRRIGLNAAVGGPSAEHNDALDAETKRRWGPLAFVAAAVDAAADLRPVRTRVVWDGTDVETWDVVGAAVSNGRTAGGGVPLAPDARLDDGLLDVSVVRTGTTAAYIGLAAALVAGRLPDHPLTVHRRVRSVRFEPVEPLPFNLDGDLVCTGGITFSLAPCALRVWAPLEP